MGIAYVLATVFQCTPIPAFWNKTIRDRRCINKQAFWTSYSALNIATDLFVLALPIRQIISLHLPRIDKFAVLGVFLLGAFVCVTTIVRTTTLASSAKDLDPTWGPIPATIWSVVEANTGIICACLPMLRRPLWALFPRLFSNSDRSSRSCSGGSAYRFDSRSAQRSANSMNLWPGSSGTVTSSVEVPRLDAQLQQRDSEEEVLPNGNSIIMTTDVTVKLSTCDSTELSLKNYNHI
ncbi:hypothetical protein LTR16_003847 [Cryomyces antarcticus]|uniref:Rhodopsin domain-containing protein n=1 Tax=Cryomyces antarcticus TaxID=329879 RepID=A0ABR0LNN8_9PEZI|nr:hypothetical protein LTR16_003847 [Cryomyces antarcticus]